MGIVNRHQDRMQQCLLYQYFSNYNFSSNDQYDFDNLSYLQRFSHFYAYMCSYECVYMYGHADTCVCGQCTRSQNQSSGTSSSTLHLILRGSLFLWTWDFHFLSEVKRQITPEILLSPSFPELDLYVYIWLPICLGPNLILMVAQQAPLPFSSLLISFSHIIPAIEIIQFL